MRWLQRRGEDRLYVHLPQRPDGPGAHCDEGVQPGAGSVLGVLFVRQDLPLTGH